jgi:integrase
MASLRRFPDTPYWFACFTGPDGHRCQRSTKEINKKRAQRIADHYEQAAKTARLGLLTSTQARKVLGEIYQISNREELPPDTIGEFFPRWLTGVKIQSGAKTYQRYSGITTRFLKWLGPKCALGVQHLSSTDIVRYRDYLAKTKSPSSVNLTLGAISAALGRAFDDHLVDVNEASRVTRLADDPEKKQERREFTSKELRAILKVADTEWRGMILCGAYHGMRVGDVASLRWSNVDLESGEFRFKMQKSKKEKPIPIGKPFYRYLLEIAGDDPDGPLFPRAFALRQRDIPTGTLSNQFYRLMTKAGVVEKRTNKAKKEGPGRAGRRKSPGLGFHCLRYTATTLLKRGGASDVIAREIVGHESAAVSRIYTRIDTDTLRRAIDKMPDLTTEE